MKIQTKIFACGVLFIILVFSMISSAKANTYGYGTIGYNKILGFSIGSRNQNIGFEFGFGIKEYSSDLLDYPCPHSDYRIIEDDYLNVFLGADVLRFLNLSEKVFVYGGIGAYFVGYQDIAKSNVTGWLYEQSSETKFEPAFSGGIQFHINEKTGFGLGYHSIRGISIQFIFIK